MESDVPVKDSPYFAIQAEVGITKHMGGRQATDELARRCHLKPGMTVLEIGSGLGRSACYLAKAYQCQVIGVDINPEMVRRAQQRAKRNGLVGRVDFVVADACHLPYSSGRFDAVIAESVTAFTADRQQALLEYARVVKPQGYVGINEVTWVRAADAELERFVSFIMAGAEFANAEQWQACLAGAGLHALQTQVHPFKVGEQLQGELSQFDGREYATAWKTLFVQLVRNPAYRHFAWDVLRSPRTILRFVRSIGYGVYSGRKP